MIVWTNVCNVTTQITLLLTGNRAIKLSCVANTYTSHTNIPTGRAHMKSTLPRVTSIHQNPIKNKILLIVSYTIGRIIDILSEPFILPLSTYFIYIGQNNTLLYHNVHSRSDTTVMMITNDQRVDQMTFRIIFIMGIIKE